MSSKSDMSWVVPVCVSSKSNPAKEMLVYALIDSMSETSHIPTNTVNCIQPEYKEAHLSVRTMTSENRKVDCHIVKDLIVRAYNKTDMHELPPTYSQNNLPINRKHIPTSESLHGWPHLLKVAEELPISYEQIPVGLLIGYDFKLAFHPQEVVDTNNEEEPFAIRTALGWSVMGNAGSETNKTTLTTAVVN